MAGHHPWKTLLDGLTPERRKAIAAGAAKIRADIEHREQQLSSTLLNFPTRLLVSL
jgi:hypothetical protein